MALTELDAGVALVAIDLQKGILQLPTAHPPSEIVARTARLARAFREHALPVVLVKATGRAPGRTEVARARVEMPPEWIDFVDELEPYANDCVIAKRCWSAFAGTELDAELRRRGVTQVVVTGVATSVGVESTARSAYDLGYNVVLALDAITDREIDAHRYSVERIFPRLGETCMVDDILTKLKAR